MITRRIILGILAGLALLPRVAFAAPGLGTELVADRGSVERTLGQPLTLTVHDKQWAIPPGILRTWIRTRQEGDTTFVRLHPGRIYDYLNRIISPAVNDTGENARIVFRDGKSELKAAGRKGSIVDGVKTSLAIRNAALVGGHVAAVAMKPYAPPVLGVKDFERLGIRDLLARGETDFRGSPANRKKNIAVGRLRFQGILVAPDEEFSFQKFLGPVTKDTGYLPELVIKEHVTTPEFGGGLCQVSTTVFRAAVRAGMDITLRRAHAYPVKYYGTPGFDATIYPPFPDLRFRNTTGQWVLLQTALEGTKLIVLVYGKSDGRTVSVDGPHTIEKRPDGSVRTLLRQTVKDKNGTVIHDELFPSTYKSPDLFPTVRKENGEL